jgi:hypothetical protein
MLVLDVTDLLQVVHRKQNLSWWLLLVSVCEFACLCVCPVHSRIILVCLAFDACLECLELRTMCVLGGSKPALIVVAHLLLSQTPLMSLYLPLPVLQLFGFSSISAIKEKDEFVI